MVNKEKNSFNIFISGLGLMGGSLAYALKGFNNCTIYGFDVNKEVIETAKSKGAIDFICPNEEDGLEKADFIIYCTFPYNIEKSFAEKGRYIKKGTLVTEICGVKRKVIQAVENLPEDVNYIGIHPMAGKEVGGFHNADKNIFINCGFIIIPTEKTSPDNIRFIEKLAEHIGTKRTIITSAEEHDEIIAYSSDLMHISASMLCIGYPKNLNLKHTAGAFRDCTRIASLDPELWTELFLENKENTLKYLDIYIENLKNLKNHLQNEGSEQICNLLAEASKNKNELLVK